MELIIWLCAVELLLIISGAILIIFDEAAIFMLVLVVAIMVCGRMFRKEEKEFGIYKSQGFSTNYLRFLLAVESISLIRFSWFTSLAPGS